MERTSASATVFGSERRGRVAFVRRFVSAHSFLLKWAATKRRPPARNFTFGGYTFTPTALMNRDGWRIRVGAYRVLYFADIKARQITVGVIGHRRDVYRD
jgi:hypothetical protein